MHDWRYYRDLELDLFAAQRRRGGQGRNLVERAPELRLGLDQRRARQRLPSSLTPKARRLLDQTCLGAVARQKLGLALCDVDEPAF